jgi:hypothetical protein
LPNQPGYETQSLLDRNSYQLSAISYDATQGANPLGQLQSNYFILKQHETSSNYGYWSDCSFGYR